MVYVKNSELRIDVQELFAELEEEDQNAIVREAAFEEIAEDIMNVIIGEDVRCGALKGRWINMVRQQILEHFGTLEKSYFKTLLHRLRTREEVINTLVQENKKMRQLLEPSEVPREARLEARFPDDEEVESLMASHGLK